MWTYGTFTYQYFVKKIIDVLFIIYSLICNVIHTPFVRHPVQINGENMLWEKGCKNTDLNTSSHFLF